jgi:hypothetical protein
MKRWFVLPLVFGLVAMSLAALAGPAAASRHTAGAIKVTRVHNVPASQVKVHNFAGTRLGRMIATRGYLPQHPYTFRYRVRPTGQAGPNAQPNVTSPTVLQGWNGVNDTGVTPPDTTGAAGETSYIEAINRKFAIYTRTGTLTTSKGMKPFVGAPDSFNTDPQIIWDPGTNAFYYVLWNYNNDVVYYGWSKTANPSTLTSSSWCQFTSNYYAGNNEIPDYPKLGDTTNFGLIGFNVFNASSGVYKRSEVFMFQKHALGSTSTCGSTPSTWESGALSDGSGFDAYTPVPAVQTDTNALGYIVAATPDLGGTFPECGDELTIFEVTGTISPAVSAPTNQTVPEYDLPYLIPQKGTSVYLDPLDCRLTQAMTGIDPNAGSTSPGEIWTQHAVADPITGNPTQVNWYEIHGIGGLDQSGTVFGTSTFAFNGSISSDRSVPQGSAAQFGGAMVLGFDTSSSTQYVTIRMVSKVGVLSQSSWVTIKSSKGFNRDFGCSGSPKVCRWGDYSGASADPRASILTNGHVWLANEYNVVSANNTDVDARTHVWEAAP